MNRPIAANFALFAIIAASALIPSSVPAAKARPGWVIPETLNVRSGPGTDREKIGTLTRGTKVHVTAFANNWCWSKLPDGSWGWIAEWLLQFSADKGRAMAEEAAASSNSGGTTKTIPAWIKEDAVNVRSGPGLGYEKHATFQKGRKVYVTDRKGDWCKVSTGNGYAWILGELLEYDVSRGRKLASSGPATTSSGGSASSNTTKGFVAAKEVNLRKGPGTSYDKVAKVVEGQTVYITETKGDWCKATVHGGNSGWIAKWLVKTDDGSGEASSQPTTAKGFVIGQTVNLRKGPGTSYDKLAMVVQGQTLYITETKGDWYKATIHGGNSGWIAKWLVKLGSEEGSSGSQAGSSGPPVGKFKAMPAWVCEEVANVRVGPNKDNDVAFQLERGTKVTATELDGHWVKVKTAEGKMGWAAAWVVNFVPPGEGITAKEGSETVNVHVGWVARPKVNLRSGPSEDSPRIGEAELSTRVIIVGQEGNWYKVAMDNGEVGWMASWLIDTRGQRLARRNAGDAAGDASGSDTAFPSPTTSAHSGKGATFVNTAMQYLGHRYVRGSASPGRGFDCSGFVHYVMKQHGIRLPRSSATQMRNGQPVSRGSLEPGDVVFFRNTYKQGISHVGIYVEGDTFIHASNSRRGVVTDSLNSSYYAPRYAGARRMY